MTEGTTKMVQAQPMEEKKLVRKIFYDENLPAALRKAQAYAGTEGYVYTLPDLLAERVKAENSGDLWRDWFTGLSGEYALQKGGKTFVVVSHGTQHPLAHPERIEQAYKQGLTRQHAAVLIGEEARDLLNAEKNEILSLADLKKGAKHGRDYSVVIDFKDVQKPASGYAEASQAYGHPLVIARSGGVAEAKAYIDAVKQRWNLNTFWNSHPFNDIDPREAQGRLLFGGSHYDGLGGDDGLDGSGRFAGVAPEAHSAKKIEASIPEVHMARPQENGLESKLVL